MVESPHCVVFAMIAKDGLVTAFVLSMSLGNIHAQGNDAAKRAIFATATSWLLKFVMCWAFSGIVATFAGTLVHFLVAVRSGMVAIQFYGALKEHILKIVPLVTY